MMLTAPLKALEARRTYPKTNWEIMYMTTKPLSVVPFVTVSIIAPNNMMEAVVTLPHFRPILSPMNPRKHMPRIMPSLIESKALSSAIKIALASAHLLCPLTNIVG
jgi:hypothetical protein